MTKKSIKVLAVTTLALSAFGTASALPTSNVEAASVTQTSGNESVGKYEAVTNPFKTFESAENFAFGEIPKILDNYSYKTHVAPAPTNGYRVLATIDYGEITSKAEAQNAANKVVQASDAAIAAEAKADTDKPAEDTAKPTDKPTDKPAEDTAKPSEPAKPAEDTAKPTDKPTDKPADKPTDKPADKPTDKLIDKKEIAKTEKINKDTNTTETQKDVGKEVLPNTGESFSNSVLLGSILALFGLAITYKLKLSKK